MTDEESKSPSDDGSMVTSRNRRSAAVMGNQIKAKGRRKNEGQYHEENQGSHLCESA